MDITAAHREPDLWSVHPAEDPLMAGVESILSAVTRLPIRFWKPNLFFTGARDSHLKQLTAGRFPKAVLPRKSHPVYTLQRLPDHVGVVVCPCTSRRPQKRGSWRYIRKGCELRHTGFVMDRDSFLLEKIRFNIPRSVAHELRFRGEVPNECLKTALALGSPHGRSPGRTFPVPAKPAGAA